MSRAPKMDTNTADGALLAALIAKCHAAEVTKVYASTQYGMGFLVANHGVNGAGIVYRDDKMPHAAREALAVQLNAALAKHHNHESYDNSR